MRKGGQEREVKARSRGLRSWGLVCYTLGVAILVGAATATICLWWPSKTEPWDDEFCTKAEMALAVERFAGIIAEDDVAVVRGNGLAAMELLRREMFARDSKPLLIRARLFRTTYGALGLDAWALTASHRRTHAVFVFVDEQGRTVKVLYRLASSDGPVWVGGLGGFCGRAVVVPRRRLAELAKEVADGTNEVSDPSFADLPPAHFYVPDGDVAVGVRNPDGTYSNFVPLIRPTPAGPQATTGTTRPAGR